MTAVISAEITSVGTLTSLVGKQQTRPGPKPRQKKMGDMADQLFNQGLEECEFCCEMQMDCKCDKPCKKCGEAYLDCECEEPDLD